MAYGTIKVDTITFTDGGVDKSVSVSGLVENPTFTGNVTATGTISGDIVRGQTISGVTVTGITANFTSGNFTNISGGTHTITSGVFALGTAANPSISFVSDSNTGIYSPGADQVAISTNGTGRLFVDSSGNLLVGANANSGGLGERVSINGAGIVTQSAAQTNRGLLGTFGGSTQIFGTFDNIPIEFRTNNTERMRLDSSGRLGLGTSTPSYRGHIASTIAAGGAGWVLGVQETTREGGVLIGSYGNASSYLGAIQAVRWGVGASSLLLNPDGGSVGIGTTSPSELLTVAPSSGIPVIKCAGAASTVALIEVTANSNTVASRIQSNLDAAFVGTTSNHPFFFLSNNAERARIDTSGRLLVGTSTGFGNSTFTKAEFVNSASYTNIVVGRTDGATGSGSTIGVISFLSNAGGTGEYHASIAAEMDAASGSGDKPGRLVFSTTADGASSPTERVRINQQGTMGVFCTASTAGVFGTSAAAGTIAVVFACRHSASSTTAGTDAMYVYSNGNIVNTNNSYGAISDIKLKENIVDASSQWDDLKALQVRNYNFKEGQTHTQIGLVAQEVELVSPGLVTESPDRDADGNDLGTVTKSVNYSVLYMKAVKALQEAMERIETLEAKVAALESK